MATAVPVALPASSAPTAQPRAPALEWVSCGRLRVAPGRLFLQLWALIVLLVILAPFSRAGALLAPAAALALAAASALDLVWGWRQARRLRIGVEAVARLTEGRSGIVPLFFQRRSPKPLPPARIGLAFHGPELAACGAPAEAAEIPLAAAGAVRWEAGFHPRHRGLYAGLQARVQAPSRLGLWKVLGELSLPVALKVYPDWRPGWRAVLASPLYQFVTGMRQQLPTGQGREFDRLREYLPGDAYPEVSWKATARRGYPVTRLFQWEQMQRIYVGVDHARLSALRPAEGSASQLDLYADATLALLAACAELGDAYGLFTFADALTSMLRAAAGPAQFNRVRERLLRLKSERVNPEFDLLLANVASLVRRRSQFLLLTDVSEPGIADSLFDAIATLARNHLVSVHCLLPEGVERMFEGRRPPAASLPEIYARLAGHREYLRLDAYRREMARCGVTVRFAGPRQFLLSVVETYLEAKRRQAL